MGTTPWAAYAHRARWAGGLAALILCTQWQPACRQIVGVEDRDRSCGALPLPSSGCDACTRANCCDAMLDCERDLYCSRSARCTAACSPSDESCRTACSAALWEFGRPDVLGACQSRHCASDCKRPCGGWSYRVEGCAECMQQQCCEPLAACADDAHCRGLEACVQACPPAGWGCFDECVTEFPAGTAEKEFAAWTCFTTDCATSCDRGENWSCVGDVGRPDAFAQSFDVHFSLLDFALRPISGLVLRACTGLGSVCPDGAPTDTSDAQGKATLTVTPIPGDAFRGWFEVVSTDRLPARVVYEPALTGTPHHTLSFPVPNEADIEALNEDAPVPIDLTRAHLLAFFLDCGTQFAPRLAVSTSSPDAVVAYLKGIRPDFNLTSTDGATGAALILNAPPGPMIVTATHVPSGAIMTYTQNLRVGELTVAFMAPTR